MSGFRIEALDKNSRSVFRCLTCCCLFPQSSYIDVTPSPNKLLADHPLSTFIKTEQDEEVTSCSVATGVKQELESELPAVKKEDVVPDEVPSEPSEA